MRKFVHFAPLTFFFELFFALAFGFAGVISDPLSIQDAVSSTREAPAPLEIGLRGNCRRSRSDIRTFLLPLRHAALASQLKTRSKLGLHHLPITAPVALVAFESRDDLLQGRPALWPSRIPTQSVWL